MSPVYLVVAVVFGIAGFQEARRFGRQYGRTPWGWDPLVWGVVMFLSFIVGLILIAIAERQGRRHPLPTHQQAGQFAYAGTAVPTPAVAYGALPAAGNAPVDPVTAAVPAAQWAADPRGRHQYRWWDGSAWSEHVVTAGVSSRDPLGA
jgi:hypothetical protein